MTSGPPHFVEMGHSQPSRLRSGDVEKIKELACRAVKAVGIDHGPAHVEIMLTADGPKMIELGARLGGDFITSHLVPLSTGVDMIGATIQIALGEIPNLEKQWQKGAAIRFFSVPKGTVEKVRGIEFARQLSSVREVTLLRNIENCSFGDVASSTDRVGFVITQDNTATAAEKSCEQAVRMVTFQVKREGQ